MEKIKINIRLLRSIQRAILKEPKQFQMDAWFATQDTDPSWYDPDMPAKIPNCGTAACIGGWAIALTLKKNPDKARSYTDRRTMGTFNRAQKVLGLEGNMASRLFIEDNWPDPYKKLYNRYTEKKQWKRRAQVAVRRIDHFIKTKGED